MTAVPNETSEGLTMCMRIGAGSLIRRRRRSTCRTRVKNPAVATAAFCEPSLPLRPPRRPHPRASAFCVTYPCRRTRPHRSARARSRRTGCARQIPLVSTWRLASSRENDSGPAGTLRAPRGWRRVCSRLRARRPGSCARPSAAVCAEAPTSSAARIEAMRVRQRSAAPAAETARLGVTMADATTLVAADVASAAAHHGTPATSPRAPRSQRPAPAQPGRARRASAGRTSAAVDMLRRAVEQPDDSRRQLRRRRAPPGTSTEC